MPQGVTFEDEGSQTNTVGNIASVPETPKGMPAWLVKNGIVRNAQQGEYILLGLAVLIVLIAIGVFIASSPRSVPPPTPATLGYPKTIPH